LNKILANPSIKKDFFARHPTKGREQGRFGDNTLDLSSRTQSKAEKYDE